ncbi:hypothetical protein EJ03DRAFT_323356 [Teratosphaeria nubilosa]|uniref:Uncharacterized protein n=1 Tax=Teratosphaeria nubilosa TaxID=161662 RepID=A0A6G1LM79_9PEZI|nr:hypothetical protein EJ03DRAFT_323356 [Teratosphaeria nubilosa]
MSLVSVAGLSAASTVFCDLSAGAHKESTKCASDSSSSVARPEIGDPESPEVWPEAASSESSRFAVRALLPGKASCVELVRIVLVAQDMKSLVVPSCEERTGFPGLLPVTYILLALREDRCIVERQMHVIVASDGLASRSQAGGTTHPRRRSCSWARCGGGASLVEIPYIPLPAPWEWWHLPCSPFAPT